MVIERRCDRREDTLEFHRLIVAGNGVARRSGCSPPGVTGTLRDREGPKPYTSRHLAAQIRSSACPLPL